MPTLLSRSPGWKLSALASAALIGLLGGAPASASPSRGAAAPACKSSFDPYHYRRSAVHACGYRTFPLKGVTALAGGGRQYNYRVAGAPFTIIVPPAGFHPSTATPAQLKKYGFPPRPKGGADLARWRAEMSRWKASAAPPRFLTESHAHATTSPNWSGYVLTGSNGTYDNAEVWYTEPTYYSSVCSSNSAVMWDGIGGWGNTALGQDGTAHGVPGIGNHQSWVEVWPNESMVAMPLYGHIDYLFDAYTNRLSGTGYAFWMYDYYTGTSVSARSAINNYSGNSAEAIAERPTVNGSYTNLSNFKTMTFSSSQANGSAISSYSSSKRLQVYMYNSATGDTLASPGSIGTGGYFQVTQNHCH